jgi:hypothetical protein
VTLSRTAKTLAAAAVAAAILAAGPAAALQPGEVILMSVSYLHLPSG